MAKKKLDYFNLFYSLGAVIILIGVIAKFLEWEAQDTLLLTGLTVEAFVFLMSSIQFIQNKREYRWDRIFPELITEGGQRSSLLDDFDIRLKRLVDNYSNNLEDFTNKFNGINTEIISGTEKYTLSMDMVLQSVVKLDENYKRMSEKLDAITDSVTVLGEVSNDIHALQMGISAFTGASLSTAEQSELLKNHLTELTSSLGRMNAISQGILIKIKEIA